MGKGGASYHERQLTPEERALIAQQQRYLASIQPSIDKLVNRGTSLLDDVVNPDWKGIYGQTVNDIDGLRKEQSLLATGQLPKVYSDAKMNYFNRIYENTMGKGLAQMARSGVVDSSRYNSSVNDMQKNMTAQMSQDYTKDLGMAKELLDQKYQFALSPLEVAHKANQYSFANPEQHLALAQGQSRSTNEALQTQGALNNGRTTVTQKGPGFLGGLMSGIGNIASAAIMCFPEYVTVETDYGYIPIVEVEKNDVLVSKDGIEIVLDIIECGKKDIHTVTTETHEVDCTSTQTVWTRRGLVAVKDLEDKDEILTDNGFEKLVNVEFKESDVPVYELVVSGSAMFYANGICVEGFTEEERNELYSV